MSNSYRTGGIAPVGGELGATNLRPLDQNQSDDFNVSEGSDVNREQLDRIKRDKAKKQHKDIDDGQRFDTDLQLQKSSKDEYIHEMGDDSERYRDLPKDFQSK
jgi:hypothetical protein